MGGWVGGWVDTRAPVQCENHDHGDPSMRATQGLEVMRIIEQLGVILWRKTKDLSSDFCAQLWGKTPTGQKSALSV